MKAATKLRGAQALIAVDRVDSQQSATMASALLPDLLRENDLVIVNDAATLPASLQARDEHGAAIELRLARRLGPSRWRCVLLGEGSWKDDTDARRSPPHLKAGAKLRVEGTVDACVDHVPIESSRLIDVQFHLEESLLLAAIYRRGRPIQYAYHNRNLPMSWLQTPYAGRPWAVEMPSAGRAMTWRTIIQLRRRGVGVERITHSAGISATGDRDLDAMLPMKEHYDIPQQTIDAIESARRQGGRVIAIGTTVVRALEGCVAERGTLIAGEGDTCLVLDGAFQPQVVDGVLVGLHAPGESHYKLLTAFAAEQVLRAAWQRALRLGFQNHELGDAMLLVPDLLRTNKRQRAINSPWDRSCVPKTMAS